MARKNLLEGLMKAQTEDAAPPAPAQPRRQSGAIGAVSQSLADLRTRAIAEVPPELIDDAGLKDRLDEDETGIAELMESLRDYGQQVPVMLRHSPGNEGRYEIVYGRRRVLALKRLGQPVRAMVRDLDDRSLVVAQGQENAARKDLSFIEKANFARQMAEGGFDRKVICDALHVDKTVVSRMLAVTKEVPVDVILAIGAAPSAGRDRWLALARRIGAHSISKVVSLAEGDDSDARFQAVFDALAPRKASVIPERIVRSDGTLLAEAVRRSGKPVLTFHDTRFAEWLGQNMARLHQEFANDGGDRNDGDGGKNT